MEIGVYGWKVNLELSVEEIRAVLEAIRGAWPEMTGEWCDSAEEDLPRTLAELAEALNYRKVYIYASPDIRDLWEAEGITVRGANLLVTVARGWGETWFTVGASSAPILQVIQEAVERIQIARGTFR